MKRTVVIQVLVTAVFLTTTKQSIAQQPSAQHYNLTDLGALPGGSSSAGNVLDGRGVVSGSAGVANGAQHATLWYAGQKEDIGTAALGGPNSAAFGLSRIGQALMQAESSALDPANENFCGYGTGLTCLPALWENGVTTPLPTLGGNNGSVGFIDYWGESVGYAETATIDPDCPPGVAVNGTGPQLFDFEAVAWGPNRGNARILPPLPGDTVGVALSINNRGESVGLSGTCANTVIPPVATGPHAVMWDKNGSPHDLGNLGGTANTSLLGVGNAALWIDDNQDVVGASALPGSLTAHAFLWTELTGMQDLGTLSGDYSAALSVNNHGAVVGLSMDSSGNPRPFYWKQGLRMTDINSLVQADAPLYLLVATSINVLGEITGFGATTDGDIHAFLAVPCAAGETSAACAPNAPGSSIALSESVRARVRRQIRWR